MKYSYYLRSQFAIACLLSVLSATDVFARGGYGGGRDGGGSFAGSGSYGSVRQADYHSSASFGGGEASYDRQATTGPEGRTASSSGDATRGDGQASWDREATGPGGKSAEVSGDATAGDGQVAVKRQATGPNGGTISGQGSLWVGARATTLPAGYSTVSVRGSSYYYCGGYYYQPTDVGDYIIVDPPVGVVYYQLPAGATMEVTVGGVHYFTDGDVYYRTAYINGQVAYVTVPPPQAN